MLADSFGATFLRIARRVLRVGRYRRLLFLLVILFALILLAIWLMPIFRPPSFDEIMATNPSARTSILEARDAGLRVVAVPLTPLTQAYIDFPRRFAPSEFPRPFASSEPRVFVAYRWDNIILAAGGLLIGLFVLREFAFSTAADLKWKLSSVLSPERLDREESEREKERQPSLGPVPQKISPEKPLKHLTGLRSHSADAALLADVERAITLATALYSRSTLLLAGGIIMSFIGIGVFWVSLPNLPSNASSSITAYLPQAIRPIGMLFFVEAIAWFLLRQYRALIEDYKSFHRIYLRRANFLAALRIAADPHVSAGELSVAAALLLEDLTGRLKINETTEALEAAKQIEGNPVIELLLAVINRAADVASAATPGKAGKEK